MRLSRRRWDADVHARLEQLLAATHDGRPVATFDWDNTCIRGDIGEAALDWLDAADGRNRRGEYERLCETEGKPRGYAWCAWQVAGVTEPQLRETTLSILDACLADGRIAWRPEIRDLVFAMQRRGWDVWVVSASAEPLVQTAAQAYGIPADRVIGMRLAVGADGRYEPRLDGPLTFREGKVEAIDRFVGRRPTFAAGDAETDIEMLQSARHALLIDRGDAAIRRAADEGGWWVQPAKW